MLGFVAISTCHHLLNIFFCLHMIFTLSKSCWCHPSRPPLDLFVSNESFPLHEVCVARLVGGPSSISASYEFVSSWHALCSGESFVRGCEKGSPLWPQISSSNLQRLGFSPWFTAPTETKLGTATVSAPGPLSGSQDELFAEDIQMYKEQIRLTQSSFARWEREKEKGKKERWLTSKEPRPLCFLEWVKGFGDWKQPCVFKVLIHNLFL